MIQSSRLLRDSMMQSQRVPNPVVTVNRYWPARALAPSFAYTQPSYRFSKRPFALGLDLSLLSNMGTPCTSDAMCPGAICCPISSSAIPEVGLPSNLCLDEETCRVTTNQLEQALCAKHPGEFTLECEVDGWCVCQPHFNPVEGQIPPPPVAPPQTTTPPAGEPLEPVAPPPTPAKASSWTDKIDVPLVAIGGLAAIALLYAVSR